MRLFTRVLIGVLVSFVGLVIYQSISSSSPQTFKHQARNQANPTIQESTMSDLIAINICLIPASDLSLYAKAVEINQSIYQANQAVSFLYSETRRPHVTVVQSFVKQTDLNHLISELTQEIQSSKQSDNQLQLHTEQKIGSGPVFDGRWSPFIGIEKSSQLIDLHSRLMKIVEKYRVIDSSINQSNRQSIDQAIEQYPSGGSFDHLIGSFYHEDGDLPRYDTLAWVNNFAVNSAFDRYDPHITLGSANQQTMDELLEYPADSMKFVWDPQEVAVYQLGNRGTVRKQLTTIPFNKQ